MEDIDAMFLNLGELYRLHKSYKNKRRKRRYKVRPTNKNLATAGYQLRTFQRMKFLEPEKLFLHTRMQPQVFDLLFDSVSKFLRSSKQRIGPEESLSLVLLYLSQGVSMRSIDGATNWGKKQYAKSYMRYVK